MVAAVFWVEICRLSSRSTFPWVHATIGGVVGVAGGRLYLQTKVACNSKSGSPVTPNASCWIHGECFMDVFLLFICLHLVPQFFSAQWGGPHHKMFLSALLHKKSWVCCTLVPLSHPNAGLSAPFLTLKVLPLKNPVGTVPPLNPKSPPNGAVPKPQVPPLTGLSAPFSTLKVLPLKNPVGTSDPTFES